MKIKSIPAIGFGTYLIEKSGPIVSALELGYRHIDTALAYENHGEIAQAIRGWNREELWITSKFGIGSSKGDLFRDDGNVEGACDRCLMELKIDYLDLFLIHWPNAKKPMEEIFANMWRLVEKGKVRFPGVSNFSEADLERLYGQGLKVPYNQIEVQPLMQQKEFRAFCKGHGTEVVAYRPLGKGELLRDVPQLNEIGLRHGKSGAQVVLKWFAQRGIPVICKAAKKEHIKENIDLDFELSDEEMSQIDALDRGERYCHPDWSEFE